MPQRIFVVTGSNKGIGYAIVRTLAKMRNGDLIYLTARNEKLGKESLAKIDADLGGQKKSEVVYHQLDITDEPSCLALASHLKEKHGGFDVLINNAGFAFKNDATESPEEQATFTIGINYYGTKLVSDILFPLIRDGGRVVNVCSQAGIMKGIYSDSKIQQVKNAKSTKDLDAFVKEYIKRARENTRKDGGYPESAYRVSKAAEIGLTMLQYAELTKRKIIVNACCPGYVDTDMTSHKGPLTIDEGADTPVYLATSDQAPDGQFVYQRKITEWH